MKPSIILNNRLRTATNNVFEKDIFNLTINSSFGKTIVVIRNQNDMKVVNCQEKYQVCDFLQRWGKL